MARLRHIALVVKDLERAAAFYQTAFGMRRSETTESQTAFRIYLSDGVMNLALLQYKGATGSGLKDGAGFSGPHHFGFVVDDLEAAGHDIEAAGGVFFFDLGKPGEEGFERKFRDPDGTIFDINTEGWPVEFAPSPERNAAE
jgi:catechol 2,3-dioxygenase-like lactoylglutathione lyase family enzyme